MVGFVSLESAPKRRRVGEEQRQQTQEAQQRIQEAIGSGEPPSEDDRRLVNEEMIRELTAQRQQAFFRARSEEVQRERRREQRRAAVEAAERQRQAAQREAQRIRGLPTISEQATEISGALDRWMAAATSELGPSETEEQRQLATNIVEVLRETHKQLTAQAIYLLDAVAEYENHPWEVAKYLDEVRDRVRGELSGVAFQDFVNALPSRATLWTNGTKAILQNLFTHMITLSSNIVYALDDYRNLNHTERYRYLRRLFAPDARPARLVPKGYRGDRSLLPCEFRAQDVCQAPPDLCWWDSDAELCQNTEKGKMSSVYEEPSQQTQTILRELVNLTAPQLYEKFREHQEVARTERVLSAASMACKKAGKLLGYLSLVTLGYMAASTFGDFLNPDGMGYLCGSTVLTAAVWDAFQRARATPSGDAKTEGEVSGPTPYAWPLQTPEMRSVYSRDRTGQLGQYLSLVYPKRLEKQEGGVIAVQRKRGVQTISDVE